MFNFKFSLYVYLRLCGVVHRFYPRKDFFTFVLEHNVALFKKKTAPTVRDLLEIMQEQRLVTIGNVHDHVIVANPFLTLHISCPVMQILYSIIVRQVAKFMFYSKHFEACLGTYHWEAL